MKKPIIEPILEISGQAEEMKRVQTLIKKFKIDTEKAQQTGILARAPQVIDKKALRGALPDEWDKKNIEGLIETYNLAFPYPHEQSLQYVIEEGEKFTKKMPRNIRRKAKKELALVVHLPIPFSIALKTGYPLIFSDKVQFAWFLKNFPQFNLKG